MNIPQSELNALAAAFDNIAEMCDTGRLTVNEITGSIRQVDVDAAAAICRGWFMTISEYAKHTANNTRKLADGPNVAVAADTKSEGQ